MKEFKDIETIRSWIKGRHPKIRRHQEDDLEWFNEGNALLRKGSFGLAENKFQKLVLSQPNHPDGYMGLAWVYAKTERLNEARILMDYALDLARMSVAQGEMDQGVVEWMMEERQSMG